MNKTKNKLLLDYGLTFAQALDMTLDLYIKGIITDQEQEILAARLNGITLYDLGKRFYITSARVSQIEQRALRRIDYYDQRLEWND